MAETGAIIYKGKRYPIPDDWDLDEACIIHDHAGLTLTDLEAGGFDLDNPNCLRALIHICLRRDNPRRSKSALTQIVGEIKMGDLDFDIPTVVEEGGEAEADPPTPTRPEDSGKPDDSPRTSETSSPTNGTASSEPSSPDLSSQVLSGARLSATPVGSSPPISEPSPPAS